MDYYNMEPAVKDDQIGRQTVRDGQADLCGDCGQGGGGRVGGLCPGGGGHELVGGALDARTAASLCRE